MFAQPNLQEFLTADALQPLRNNIPDKNEIKLLSASTAEMNQISLKYMRLKMLFFSHKMTQPAVMSTRCVHGGDVLSATFSLLDEEKTLVSTCFLFFLSFSGCVPIGRLPAVMSPKQHSCSLPLSDWLMVYFGGGNPPWSPHLHTHTHTHVP